MGFSDYQLGYKAFLDGESLDTTRSQAWQEGWEDADADSLEANFDANLNYGDE